MRLLFKYGLYFAVSIGFISLPAFSGVIGWELTGHVTQISGDQDAISNMGGSANIGDDFTLRYSFEPTRLSIGANPPVPGMTEYPWEGMMLSMSFQIGSWEYSMSPQYFPAEGIPSHANNVIYIRDGAGGADEYVAWMSHWTNVGSNPSIDVTASWGATSASPSDFINGLALPTIPFDFNAFTFIAGPSTAVHVGSGGKSAIITGSVEENNLYDPSPVPEPSSLLLLIIGLGAVGLVEYRCNRK